LVMQAYGTRCAVCSLTHGQLLDAAHIVEDGLPKGDPVTPNGLSLCKIHHAHTTATSWEFAPTASS
jgi:putative restriction endonuclease